MIGYLFNWFDKSNKFDIRSTESNRFCSVEQILAVNDQDSRYLYKNIPSQPMNTRQRGID